MYAQGRRLGICAMKHERSSEDATTLDSTKKMKTAIDLPPELWSQVLHFLSFDEVLNCTSSNHFFHRDVPGHVKELSIEKGKSMAVSAAATDRFNNVTKISIKNLVYFVVEDRYESDEEEPIAKVYFQQLDRSKVEYIMPFITRFPKLTHICGLSSFAHLYGSFRWNFESVEIYARMLRRLCRAYVASDLSQDINLGEIIPDGGGARMRDGTFERCMWKFNEITIPSYRTDVDCQMCDLMCTSFPTGDVVNFSDDEIPCITFDNRLKIAQYRNPNNFKSQLTESLIYTLSYDSSSRRYPREPTDGIIQYDEDALSTMQKLIKFGADAKDDRIRTLLTRRPETSLQQSNNPATESGKNSISRYLYIRLERFGFNISWDDFIVTS